MKTALLSLLLGAALALSATVQAADADRRKAAADKQRAEDIADHKAIAAAHQQAAQCLESGKAEKDCHAQLEQTCKGLAIGKYCGMKHRHKH